MLLFRGSGKEWAEIRRVIERLDRAVPSVLIEVLIAEVTLTDEGKDRVRVPDSGCARQPRDQRRNPRRTGDAPPGGCPSPSTAPARRGRS